MTLPLGEGVASGSFGVGCDRGAGLGAARWLACGRGAVVAVARGPGEGVAVVTGGSAMLGCGVGTALGVAVVRGVGRVAKGLSGSTGPWALELAEGVGAGGNWKSVTESCASAGRAKASATTSAMSPACPVLVISTNIPAGRAFTARG